MPRAARLQKGTADLDGGPREKGGGAGASQETGNLRFVTALRLQHLAPAKPDVKLDKA